MRQETQWTTIFWEGWTALVLCAAAVPVLWAGWWLWAEKAPPLQEEELMAKPGRIHIVTEEALL